MGEERNGGGIRIGFHHFKLTFAAVKDLRGKWVGSQWAPSTDKARGREKGKQNPLWMDDGR